MLMTEEYKNKLEDGKKYEEYITKVLSDKYAFNITIYQDFNSQINKGESLQGIEIKNDRMMAETGNIYIEYAEKTNENNADYIESGILRKDNTWLYMIGDYNEVYLFSKKYLAEILSKYIENDNIKENKHGYKVKTTKTSKGLLIPKKYADVICLKKITL